MHFSKSIPKEPIQFPSTDEIIPKQIKEQKETPVTKHEVEMKLAQVPGGVEDHKQRKPIELPEEPKIVEEKGKLFYIQFT